MKRYLSALSDGILVGLAFVGLNRLASSPIPLRAEITAAIGAVVVISILKLYRRPSQGHA